ncbi:hypothetical protein M9458_056548 [Cirrhinus mrigala]|uniref:Uncharacterized protein n=1 Tax=Cirrhinus mrigala TaxID=683832 RepID=A0ABD0MHM2_CIRMR
MNLVGDLRSAHHQMSLSPCPYTQTVALHPRLHLPSSFPLIVPTLVANQNIVELMGRTVLVAFSALQVLAPSQSLFPSFLLSRLAVSSVSPPAFWPLARCKEHPSASLHGLCSPLIDPRLPHGLLLCLAPTFLLRMDPLASRLPLNRILGHNRIQQLSPRTFNRLRREGPRSSLAAFMDYASCVGSSFTVGVAEEQRDITVTPAVQPAPQMAAAPVRAPVMVAITVPVHKMAAKTALRHATAATPESSQVTAALPVQVAAVVPKSSQVSKSSQDTAVVPVSSQVKAVFPVSRVTAIVPESSKVTAVVPESSEVTAGLYEPSQVTSDLDEPTTADLHEPSQATADLHESSQVTVDLHEPSQAIAVPRHVFSDTPRSRPVMMASMLDPSLVSVWAANIPVASAPSNQTIKEVLPPAAALPLMAVAIWCVWAAHCVPEVSSDHKSAPEVLSDLRFAPEVPSDHKSAPEVSSGHKSAPEISSVLKSAPEVSPVHGSAPEVSPVDRSAPEVSSGHESAPEASSVGEAVPMPPEVSALAVEPPMEAALTFELSASLFVLSASSVPAFPRSQSMMRVPAPLWRAPAWTWSSNPRPVSLPPHRSPGLLFGWSVRKPLFGGGGGYVMNLVGFPR